MHRIASCHLRALRSAIEQSHGAPTHRRRAAASFRPFSQAACDVTSASAPAGVSTPIVAPTSPTAPRVTERLPPTDGASPLYGLPVRLNLPEYTYEEVDRHNTPASYWIVIDSHVYDVTHYAARHPGGGIQQTFARGHGTDVGKAFQEVHSAREKRMTASLLIGRIQTGSVSKRVATPRPVPTLELEDEPLTEWTDTPRTTQADAATAASSSTSASESTAPVGCPSAPIR